MKVGPMRIVTRDEYHAFIRQFPTRTSSRTGICEPPQEHCVHEGTLIGRIVLADPHPRVYEIADQATPEVTG